MRSVKVKVKAIDHAGGIDWTVDSKPPKQAKLEFKKDAGAHEIVFNLDDDTDDRELRFDCSYPIWVGEDCPCPPSEGINTDQVQVIECSRKKLTIIDGNFDRARILCYQLNFVDKDGNPHDVDPEIKNGGGIKGIL